MLKLLLKTSLLNRLIAQIIILAILAAFLLPLFTVFESSSFLKPFLMFTKGAASRSLIQTLLFSCLFGGISCFAGLILASLSIKSWRGKFIITSFLFSILFIPDFLHFLISNTLLMFWNGKLSSMYAFSGNFTFGMVLSYLWFSAAMGRIPPSELEAAEMLGAQPAQLFKLYLWPKFKSGFLTVSAVLSAFNVSSGILIYHRLTPHSWADSTPKQFDFPLTWLLKGTEDLFADPSGFTGTYAIMLIVTALSILAACRLFSGTCSSKSPKSKSTSSTAKKSKSGKPKVTRKAPKKKKAKKEPKPKKEKPKKEKPKKEKKKKGSKNKEEEPAVEETVQDDIPPVSDGEEDIFSTPEEPLPEETTANEATSQTDDFVDDLDDLFDTEDPFDEEPEKTEES
jgi:ABC-type spermidine/putrescine transport system permease subunit II